MGRPPLDLGTAGRVRVYAQGDRFRARTLYRDYDGRTRAVERTGKTRGAARRALSSAVRDRAHASDEEMIASHTTVEVAAEHWFAGLAEAGRSPSTLQAYRERLDNQVLPTLGQVRLRELSVGLIDRHLMGVRASNGNAVAKQTKSVLSGVCGLATRYNAIPSNPCREASRISTKPKRAPKSMSVEEVRALLAWLATDPKAQQHDLLDLVTLMVATGLRIGEVLAVSWSAVDLHDGTLAVQGTVLRVKGEGLVVRPTPKSPAGERVLQLPSWAVTMLTGRKAGLTADQQFRENRLVLATASGLGLRDPANTRRALREAFAGAGMEGLTSHVFRKTVAALMDEAELLARQAADQLGHAKPSMTADVYDGRRTRATGAAAALEAPTFRET